MSQLRNQPDVHQLTNGPAKLCQALGVDTGLNVHDLGQPPLQLRLRPPISQSAIAATTRIGISKDQHRLWRFYVRNNPYVSRPR
jgi:DNA-3-methyladenine glycosylase